MDHDEEEADIDIPAKDNFPLLNHFKIPMWQSLILRLRSCTGGLRDEATAFTYFVLSKDKRDQVTLCLDINGS